LRSLSLFPCRECPELVSKHTPANTSARGRKAALDAQLANGSQLWPQ